MWTVATLPKARVSLKHVIELLPGNIIQGFLHHDATHFPRPLLRPDPLVLDCFGDGTFWNAM